MFTRLRLILCCSLLCSAGLGAAEPRNGCGTLRVAFYEDGALYYQAADGSWTGIDKDVVDEAARRMGCTIQSSTDSRVRIWAGLSGGSIDMSVSALATPEREKIGRFVPYLAERNYVLLNKDIAPRVHSMDEFLANPGYKIAVIKSFRHGKPYDAWLDQLRKQGRVFETADYGAMLRLFKLGRVHAVMSLTSGWYPLVKQEQMAGTYRIMDWGPRQAIVGGLILSRRSMDETTVSRFQQTIRAMRDDGTLRRIFERHLDPELAAQLVNF